MPPLHPTSLIRPAFAQDCAVLCVDAYNVLNYRILGGGYCGAYKPQIFRRIQSLPEVPMGIFGRLCCVLTLCHKSTTPTIAWKN